MTVFNLYFKILKKYRKSIAIPIFICLAISLNFIQVNQDSSSSSHYTETKTPTAIISQEDSPLVEGLKQYLSDYAAFIPMEKEEVKDALFFRQVEYVIFIPSGFYEQFMKGEDVTLSKQAIEQSFGSVKMDNRIETYLNTWQAYHQAIPELSAKELEEKTTSVLSEQVNVSTIQSESDNSKRMNRYYNISEYSTLCSLISGMVIVLHVLNKTDLKKRMLCSPMKAKHRNVQLVLANFIFAFAIFLINVVVAMVLYKQAVFSPYGFWLSANLFVFTITTMCIGLLIAELISSREAQTAVTNVVALSMCFLSGAFVPQELMGESVRNLAKFTPGYWFVEANDRLSEFNSFSYTHMKEIFQNFAIVLCFGIAFLSVSLLIGKQKSENGK